MKLPKFLIIICWVIIVIWLIDKIVGIANGNIIAELDYTSIAPITYVAWACIILLIISAIFKKKKVIRDEKSNIKARIITTLRKIPKRVLIISICIILLSPIVLYTLMDYPIYFLREPKIYDMDEGAPLVINYALDGKGGPKSLYDLIPDILKPKSYYDTPLQKAIVNRDHFSVNRLLLQGADPKVIVYSLFVVGPEGDFRGAKIVFNMDAYQTAQFVGDEDIEKLIKKHMKPWWQFW